MKLTKQGYAKFERYLENIVIGDIENGDAIDAPVEFDAQFINALAKSFHDKALSKAMFDVVENNYYDYKTRYKYAGYAKKRFNQANVPLK